MSGIHLRPINSSDEVAIGRLLKEHWGDRRVVSRGKVFDAAKLPGFVAVEDSRIIGLVTLHVEYEACEVVTLDAFASGKGVGSALLGEAERLAISRNCKRIWLITTNDNVGALTFYQKLGLRIVAVHLDAVDEARKIKPQIPYVAENRIPIRDEIELEKRLSDAI
jgi:ribosomal protein S18 acetylase RimI-like enzyme